MGPFMPRGRHAGGRAFKGLSRRGGSPGISVFRKFWGHGGDPLRPSVRRACDRDGVKGPGRDEGRGKRMKAGIQATGTHSGSDLAAVFSGRRPGRRSLGEGGSGRGFPKNLIVGGFQDIEIQR
jgi:hypothetical protein